MADWSKPSKGTEVGHLGREEAETQALASVPPGSFLLPTSIMYLWARTFKHLAST